MSRPAEMTPYDQAFHEANTKYEPKFGDNYTMEKLLELVNAVPGEMLVQYARKRLTIEDMRDKVKQLLADNVFYFRNNNAVDTDRNSTQFQKSPVLVYTQDGGKFCVGARFSTKWLKVANGKNALTGIEREKVEVALRGIIMLVHRGVFDEQIQQIDDARREQIKQAKLRKADKKAA